MAAFAGLRPYFARMRSLYPRQALTLTEFGAEANRYEPPTVKQTYAFQERYLRRTLAAVAANPWLAGAIYWTAREFAVKPYWDGGAGIPLAERTSIHNKGLIAYDGTPKTRSRRGAKGVPREPALPRPTTLRVCTVGKRVARAYCNAMPETNRARGYRGHEVRAPIASVLAASTLLLAVVLATAAPRIASPDVSPTGPALPDKAGGSRRPSGATLTLTNPNAGTGDVDEFTHAVSRLSHGRMRVSVSEFAYYMQLDRANSLVRDLQAGRVQLAKIDTRELDRAGVSALRALTAPGLIDSLALEQRVLESAISRQMLSSFRRLGLVGLAIVPGELFKPVGITRTLLAPRDFRGATFYVTPSDVDTATLRALGARPIAHVYERIKPVDGLETSVHPFYFAHSVHHGRVTSATNLNLWPRLSAIFMSARVFDRLAPDQQRILRTAGARLVASAIARVRSQTAESTRVACARGVRLMRARAADVAAFKRALRPVLASLDRDAQTRRFISAIARMKQQLGTGPDAQSCGKPAPRPPVSTRPTPIDGVYRSDVTVAQLNRVPSFEAREYGLAEYGHFTLVLRRGRFRWSGASVHGDLLISGTFALHGPVVTLRPVDPIDFAGNTWTYRWSRYRDILSFRKVGRAPALLVVHPWRRASP
ncbi:MAG: TRAP transporter substrate-binding protein DctP [Chloroflexota bacterium]|nr:TRAP transporter substrate-binding protein DctP [Chloroflexota bacterium]